MYREPSPILDKEIIVLTVNHRLSQRLIHLWDCAHIQRDQRAWQAPNILPVSVWLTQAWQRCAETDGILLTEFQAQFLWQKIIRSDTKAALPLPIKPTAALAKSAWDTLIQWNLTRDVLEQETQLQTQTFLSWAKLFENDLKQNGWFCSSQLPWLVEQLIVTKKWAPTKSIAFVGFDEYTPALQSLIKTLQTVTTVVQHDSSLHNAHIQRLEFNDSETEIATAAKWAKKILDTHESPVNIGVIIPSLADQRETVIRHFTQTFAPENILPGVTKKPVPFNISAGQRLTDSLMIKTALRILKARHNAVEMRTLSDLLRSPYLNSTGDESAYAAQLDSRLREDNHWKIGCDAINAYFSDLNAHYTEASFPQRWQAWLKVTKNSSQQLPSEWAKQFAAELTAVGWPGQRILNSDEFQWLTKWKELSQEFSALDGITQPLSRREATKLVSDLAQHTAFQPKTNPEAPIQILGLLEASGYEFDYLWVLGVDDETWPPPANPNPFLPYGLQKKHCLPHASAEREWNYAQRIQQRLENSSKNILFSSSKQKNDRALLASTFIENFPEMAVEDLMLPKDTTITSKIFLSKKTESIHDNQGPALSKDECVQGGSWILQHQSACSFRAFSKIRLNAHGISDPKLGLNAAERGTLVHRVLEHLWKKIKTSKNLHELSASKMNSLITETIEQILQKENAPPIFLSVEKKRLKELTHEWLEFEKKRPPFTVSQRETVRFVEVGPLSLRIQIDRIDNLEKNGDFIIDYKTKRSNRIDDWFGDRPRDLQLPLYSVYATGDPIGIAYAQIRGGKMQFKGLMDESHDHSAVFSEMISISTLNFNGVILSWNEIRLQWQQTLERLATHFSQGFAAVDPVDPVTACEYCDLHAFCRIED